MGLFFHNHIAHDNGVAAGADDTAARAVTDGGEHTGVLIEDGDFSIGICFHPVNDVEIAVERLCTFQKNILIHAL